jgi:hypothetical protein
VLILFCFSNLFFILIVSSIGVFIYQSFMSNVISLWSGVIFTFLICCVNCVTHLINVLPGSSSVNMVHYATLEEAVFSMSSASSNSRHRVLCDQLLGYATGLTVEL